MRLHVVASCTACEPAVFAEAFAGPASPEFRSTPLAQKTGMDFARAIVADPALRMAFVAEFVEAERQASPGCEVNARVDGVAMIGSLAMIVSTVRAECTQAPGKVRAAYFSGYDGACLHRVRVLWAGWSALPSETQQRIEAFLQELRFAP